ncbi:MAG: zinc ribbon domain-containing protein [Clostridiaceae bacterium]|nr:zinc ribbon domain-containing protein [Clostridiaceae bacterium]
MGQNADFDLGEISVYLWIILLGVLFIQGAWIFRDASKKGENKWLWGIFGLLNVPTSLIVYLIVTRVIAKSSPCPDCGKNVRENYKYCPHCGRKTNVQNDMYE